MLTHAANVDELILELGEHILPADRVRAREQLTRIGSPAVPELIAALNSQDVRTRWEAGKTLAGIADPVAAEALVAHLDDPDPDVRWVLGMALFAIGRASVVPLLHALLDNEAIRPSFDGAHAALHALARNDLQPILQPVLAALGSHEPEIATPVEAAHALDQLRGRAMT
jgi:HEAT repeat protein